MATGYLKKVGQGATWLAPCFCLWLLWQPQEKIVLQAETLRCVWPHPEFVLKWRHSVEKQYWQEAYVLENGSLHLRHTYIQAFGAGVPVSGSPIPAPPGYVGLSSEVRLPEINWMVSRNMQGEMRLGQRVLPLYRMLPDYTAVNIAPVRQSRLQWFFEKDC
ncbi:hypothetical protein HMPREF9371_1416 [Neisseria shayeganii 871]|uniref:DUF1850 domain-containing protein n=1 Tax=Neisseria shayeganii 871 TaxID=1032488 RepID=G4CIF6_9NEIS|nr:hypothetical protein HMPREF9371_1416 [Neisseria shayeganii 871]